MKTFDISHKIETRRYAKAYGKILLPPDIIERIKNGQIEKGDVIKSSEITGILAAKKTSEILPFCHPIPIDDIKLDLKINKDNIEVLAEVSGIWRTGYEMEAIIAVSAALANIYDMCKPYKKEMIIKEIKIIEKGGGKSDWFEDLKGLKAAVITVSDSAFQDNSKDKSGPAIVEKLKELSATVLETIIVPDEPDHIEKAIERLKDKVNIIITTGGTGVSERDITPEITRKFLKKEISGLSEAMRIFGFRYNPRALLSRAKVGIISKDCIIINLPGSKKGATESLDIIAFLIKHALKMARGEKH